VEAGAVANSRAEVDRPLPALRGRREPFEPGPAAIEEFAGALAAMPPVRCVGADVTRLWNGDEEVESTVRLVVDAPIEADVLTPVLEAAKSSVLAGLPRHSAEIGLPNGAATILYEAGT
jgi:hypothetical protein